MIGRARRLLPRDPRRAARPGRRRAHGAGRCWLERFGPGRGRAARRRFRAAAACPTPAGARQGGAGAVRAVLDASGRVLGVRAATPPIPVTERDRRDRRRRAAARGWPTATPTACTCACSPRRSPGGGALMLGRSLEGVDRDARAAARSCSRCSAWPASRSPRCWAAARPTASPRCSTAWSVPGRAAPARRRRVARAAHAGDRAAHERRAAAGRRGPAARRSDARCSPTSSTRRRSSPRSSPT